MAASGYEVTPDLLRQAASGINDTIAELKTLGISEVAEEGRGFGSLELTGSQAGNEKLRAAFADFCDRWSWGVRSMVKDGNQIARQLGLSAGTYHDAEMYAVGVLKDVVNAVAGNPRANEQQVENGSFGQIFAADAPDYSAASWSKTAQGATTAWSGVAKDAVTTAENWGF